MNGFDIDVTLARRGPGAADFSLQARFAAPNGITGLETALVSLHHYFVAERKFGWDLVVKRYSAEPRRMMGLEPVPVEEGKPAELLLFDPEKETTFSAGFMRSKSRNTPCRLRPNSSEACTSKTRSGTRSGAPTKCSASRPRSASASSACRASTV